MIGQGEINGVVTRLMDKRDELTAFMADKTDEQKRQARIHYEMLKFLRDKK